VNPVSYELLLFSAAIGLLAIYRWMHSRREHLDPSVSARKVHDRVRADWVEAMTRTPANGILAVQTLRNSVMAASFLASTAALALAGTMAFSSEVDRLSTAWHRAHGLAMATELFPLKVFLLMSAFFGAFLLCSLSIRLYNHAGYAVAVQDRGEVVARYINRAGHLYGNGLRVFYLAFPVVAWLFDATMMLAAMIGVLWIRWQLDTAEFPAD
jgi:uncharacterized membrane protein